MKKRNVVFVSLFLLFFVSNCTNSAQTLHQLFEEYQHYRTSSDPFLASSSGDRSANKKLPNASVEALSASRDTHFAFLQRLERIPYSSLNHQDKVNYRLFQRMISDRIEAFELGEYTLPLNGWWDYHATFAEQPNRMPFQTVEDYENYIERMLAFEVWNEQYLDRLTKGIDRGWVRPKVVLENYIPTVEALITEPNESRFMQPFDSFPESFSEADKRMLRTRGLEVISEIVMPEYIRLAQFLRNEYLEAAPIEPGISNIPGGDAYYAYLVRHFTTLDITPDEIHEIGLGEVARIRAEMLQLIDEIGFEGSFDDFVHFLRTDPQFYAETADELMRYTAWVMKRMDGELPRFFGKLPRMPYGLREIPDYMAPRMTTAFYSAPPRDGSRAGFYYINTYNLPSRPLYEVEALSFHEAVPGHHLQLALQQELEGLPEFRLSGGFTVFVEGWALYSEWLALEMGFYQDPYSNFGRLSYEMWRALRLVVDTGIHAKGWSRQQAIDYMAENSALTLLNIRNEVDRYIFWPGQALAYKTGEIKIRELRSLAEEKLGDRFDIRAFHDAVLENGSITLEVLEEHILNWIDHF